MLVSEFIQTVGQNKTGPLKKSEELLAGLLGIDFRDYMGHVVVGVRNESSADGAHVFAPGHLLFLPHAESLIDFGSRVGEEDERE